jgi:hypothetical protein
VSAKASGCVLLVAVVPQRRGQRQRHGPPSPRAELHAHLTNPSDSWHTRRAHVALATEGMGIGARVKEQHAPSGAVFNRAFGSSLNAAASPNQPDTDTRSGVRSQARKKRPAGYCRQANPPPARHCLGARRARQKWPVRPYRQASSSPARHRPGARPARRERRPPSVLQTKLAKEISHVDPNPLQVSKSDCNISATDPPAFAGFATAPRTAGGPLPDEHLLGLELP